MQLLIFVLFFVKQSLANESFSVEGKLIETILKNYSPQVIIIYHLVLLLISFIYMIFVSAVSFD